MMTPEESLLRWMFAPPPDPTLPHSLAEALRRGLVPDEYVQEARALLNSYPYPRKPTSAVSSVRDDVPPSWDNAVRAYEEDR